jgi:hypothetical protein
MERLSNGPWRAAARFVRSRLLRLGSWLSSDQRWYRIGASHIATPRRRTDMRLRPLLSAALILCMCAPALGQEWKEFAFQQRRATAFGTPISITTDSLSRLFRVAAAEGQPGAAGSSAVVARPAVGQQAAAATNGDVLKAVPSAVSL